MITDGLTSLTAGLGTDRDKSATVTYTYRALTDQELVASYSGAWLPKRVVDQRASDCFRKWRAWQGDTDIAGKIEKVEAALGIRSKMERAKQLANLYGRAHVYFDLGDDPSQPVNVDRVRLNAMRFATVLSMREVSDGPVDDDPMSPYYGEPQYYELFSNSQGAVRLHPSRLVTFYGDESPDDLIFGRKGVSILQSTMDAIKRHDSIVANVAGLVFEARVDVITVPGLGELLSNPEQERHFLNRMRLMATMKGNNGLVMISGATSKDQPGETWDQKNTTFATLPDIIEKAQQEVSGACGIPRALLFGTSSGGLGSTGDLELSNYYDAVNTEQSTQIEPAMNVFDECLIRSALGNRPADLWYSWRSLWQMSDKEKAEIARMKAETWVKIATVLPADVIAQPMVNDFTEAGLAPGLEASYAEFIAAGGELDPEPDETDLPGSGDDTEEIE